MENVLGVKLHLLTIYIQINFVIALLNVQLVMGIRIAILVTQGMTNIIVRKVVED